MWHRRSGQWNHEHSHHDKTGLLEEEHVISSFSDFLFLAAEFFCLSELESGVVGSGVDYTQWADGMVDLFTGSTHIYPDYLTHVFKLEMITWIENTPARRLPNYWDTARVWNAEFLTSVQKVIITWKFSKISLPKQQKNHCFAKVLVEWRTRILSFTKHFFVIRSANVKHHWNKCFFFMFWNGIFPLLYDRNVDASRPMEIW